MFKRAESWVRGKHPATKELFFFGIRLGGRGLDKSSGFRLFLGRRLLATTQDNLHAAELVRLAEAQLDLLNPRCGFIQQANDRNLIGLHGARLRSRGC